MPGQPAIVNKLVESRDAIAAVLKGAGSTAFLRHKGVVSRLLEVRAEEDPNKVGVVFENGGVYDDDRLTYAMLDANSKRLARALPSLDAVKVYQKVLDMGLAKKAEAYIHKKIAESYHKFGDFKKAKQHLAIAFELEPRLKGAQKICEKLGYKRPKSAARGRISRN